MQVYLVGGAVRDKLLGLTVNDQDFVVVGATVAQMLTAGFVQVGADFPVFLHPVTREEYALARTERKQGQGYKGFSIDANAEVSLKEDLQRRDLTINAFAIEVTSLYDDTPINDQVIDYYGGLADIENKVLRHVSEAFSEDPLRVLRVARFYSRYYHLGFSIAAETVSLMQQLVNAGELAHLSAERVWQESSRATMQTSPQVYWQQLFAIGALTDYFLPLAQAWDNVHIRETVQTALYFAAQMQLNLSQRWALLMISLDRKQFAVNFDNNSPVNVVKDIVKIGNIAKVPKIQTQFATLFIEQAPQLNKISELTAEQTIDLLQACNAHKDANKFSQLLVTSHVFQLAKQHRQMMLALNSYHAISVSDIAADLEGAAIGEALRHARIMHLEQKNNALYDKQSIL